MKLTRASLAFTGLLLSGAAFLTTGAQAATPPGILIVAQSIDDIVSLDPAEGFELTTVQSFNSLYQRLVESDPADPVKLEPVVAESYEAGADGRSIVFKLRDGATFASGNPVRPEDVVFSLVRAVKLDKSPVFILKELGWNAETVEQFVTKVDDSHVKVSWPAKVGPSFALSILSAPVASIVDEKEASTHVANGDFGNGWLHNASAGSGPFKIKAYKPHEALVFDANDKAIGGAPKLKGIIFKNVADAAARRLLVEKGDADVARDLGADQVAALTGKAGLNVLSVPSAEIDYLAFNSVSPTNSDTKNPALWEAARWLVDYDSISKDLLKGQFDVHQAFLPAGFPGAYNENPFKKDVAKAKEILAKAGLDKGLTIKLDVINQPPYTDIAQALQASFGEAGIKLEVQPAVASQFYGKIRGREHEAALLFWIPDYFDAHSNASAFALNRDDGTKTVAWRQGWVIPELSDKTQAAVEETDPAKRNADYIEIQKEVQAKSPFVVLLQAKNQLVLRDSVKGFVQGLNADQVYYAGVTK
ncbi:ABC transporter substrate-binding protein [Oryzibacter oryziterrae]|uniref:ABC transporter substrate-binding protein n=1 Tax=Oryzibacter oryziterrae TaxID=2766474 RepID=UPI001F1852BC|nr:ABC transporter substrate-binding protein [Oryzibacter oryziterrae]